MEETGNPRHTPYPEMPSEPLKRERKPRLTDKQVIEIHASHLPISQIAKTYKVSRQAVYLIKAGKSRRDLNLGATQKYREFETDRALGLPHRKREEKSVTADQVLREAGLR